jgi:beta-lactamase regulating signal transducer with metallopeptidase domain
MNEILIAFLKFVSSSALLLLFYWLLLRGKSSYSACRIYLLSIPLVSLLASSVTLEVYQPEPVIVEMAEPQAGDAVTSVVTALPQSGVEVQTAVPETFLHTVSAEQVLIFSILLVSLVLILVPLINIVRLMVLCRKLDCSTTTDGYRLIHSPSVKTPFSFGATIFLPANMGEEEERVILLHEKAHIRHRHYIDVWTLEFLVRLLWFNPVLWMLRKEIRSIHEFEADRDVVDSGINVVSYQTLLLESVLDDSSVLANGFNHSFVRRRFVEMRKKVVATTSTAAKVSTVVWILIVLCGFTFTTGESETIYKASEVAYVPKSTSIATDEDVVMQKEGMEEETLSVREEDQPENEAGAELLSEEETVVASVAVPETIHEEVVPADSLPVITSLPDNPHKDILFSGVKLIRKKDVTILDCVATCSSDDEIWSLCGLDTYLIDANTGDHYKVRGCSEPKAWNTKFHLRGMKNKTWVISLKFPPLPESVTHVKISGVYDLEKKWNNIYKIENLEDYSF